MECEPWPVPTGPRAAFDQAFSEAYLIVQVRRPGENWPPESDFQASAGSGGQQVCPGNLADTCHSARRPSRRRVGRAWKLADREVSERPAERADIAACSARPLSYPPAISPAPADAGRPGTGAQGRDGDRRAAGPPGRCPGAGIARPAQAAGSGPGSRAGITAPALARPADTAAAHPEALPAEPAGRPAQ